MSVDNTIEITDAAKDWKGSIVALLKTEKLPVEDLPPSLNNFFMAIEKNKRVVGIIGLEQYGNFGLLRSMAVDRNFRNKGIAGKLIALLEAKAKASGLHSIYLLTETAGQYFEKKNYKRIERDSVPEAIKVSSEFSTVCPVSAIVMKKSIRLHE
ncbi:MAG: GNAT family N-acetyltransferase [Bacteroidetes bacterium]|nr:GNAT family N-acetyltransferase [Bacteroidota bacterium]